MCESQRGKRPRPSDRSVTAPFRWQLSPKSRNFSRLFRVSPNSSTQKTPWWSFLFSAATILCEHSLVDAQGPKLLGILKVAMFEEIVDACPGVVEIEIGRPKMVNEQSIHTHSCSVVVWFEPDYEFYNFFEVCE